MTDTIRQQIVSAIDTKLKTILTTNGYFTNLGQSVLEWDVTPVGSSETRLEYRDEEEGRTDATVGAQDMTLSLAVRILTPGSTSLASIRKMLADVVKAMHADPTWSGIADDTNVDGAAKLDKGQAADIASGVELKFRIEYSVERGAS